jgi:ribonuclease HI
MSIRRVETLQAQRVTTAAVFHDSQTAIRRIVHLDSRPGKQLARAINEYARAHHANGIEVLILWILGHSDIPGNEEADLQANLAQDARGYTPCDQMFTSDAY